MKSGYTANAFYNDRYFSDSDGLAESLFVFIRGNDLDTRIPAHKTAGFGVFNIAETGFGTGLNLLALAHSLRQTYLPPRIRWWSVEAHPLEPASIADMLSPFIELDDLKAVLCRELDRADVSAVRGWVDLRLVFADHLRDGSAAANTTGSVSKSRIPDIDLRLFIGDVSDFFRALPSRLMDESAGGQIQQSHIDAWVLDGHSPDKNPEMWSDGVFAGMAGLSRPEQSSFATFTAAGIVKQGLRKAGFFVKRSAGFAKKRHMIRGFFLGQSVASDPGGT